MANWYAVQRKSDLAIVSFVSDDVPNFNVLPPTLQLSVAFPTQQAAQLALTPLTPDPKQAIISTLMAKPSATWTLQDVADFLKNR